MILAETFLSAFDEEHFSFPREFLPFSSPALREQGQPGRSAGGITVLLRAKLFQLDRCKFELVNVGLVSLHVTTKLGFSFTILTGYRTSNAGSSFYVPDFFEDLQSKCLQLSEEQVPYLLVGDFNAKIGDADTVLGQLDEYTLLVPTKSRRPELDSHGRQLLEALSGSDLVLLPFMNDQGEYPVTCKANQKRESIDGGSVIDLAFASLPLFEFVHGLRLEFARHLSSHASLQIGLRTVMPAVDTVGAGSDPPPRKVMFFDLDRLSSFSHTPAIRQLAEDESGFSVTSALDALMGFVDGYTITVTQSSAQRQVDLDKRLQGIRQRSRKLERAMKKAKDPTRKAQLEQAMREELEAWKVERDAVAEEKKMRLRERFHEARRAGHQHLAWRLARTHLSGKGGGVRTSSTTCLSRSDWEAHFSRLFRQETPADLYNISLGSTTHRLLDSPIQPYEIERALEQKRTLRAPGPDGFRVDFLRYVRFDDVVCAAVANFFNLILNSGEVPESWHEAFLFVLYKGKGDRANPNNYRGITLKSQLLKLLESVVCSRLVNWIEIYGLLPKEQLAYRRGLSGTDHLFLLNVLMEDAISTKKTLCVGLIDLQKAFPSVDRKKLIEDLLAAGVSSRTVGLIRRLYTSDTFRLLLDGEPGHLVICVVKGVHEGSCLSPTLFIFFIRDLPARINQLTLRCPVIGGLKVSCMFFADDLTLMAYAVEDAQVLVDESVSFFEEKGLTPNPGKCEFLVFQSPTSNNRSARARWSVLGTQREQQHSARYLGLHFQENGKWDLQLQIVTSKARSALGRCKIIMRTVGTGNVKLALSFFESLVASVYRFGLGVWGPTVAKVSTLDKLFTDYIRWIFRFPRTTGSNTLLANFARRCSKCDSLFLAAVQLATSVGSPNVLWQATVADLLSGRLRSTWFAVVLAELTKRGMRDEVLVHGAHFIANRKMYGVQFSQYCFLHHTNRPTGRSSDRFRRLRPFGIFPFLLSTSSHESRYIFSFLCSVWRFIDGRACENYPDYCSKCDCENSGYHVLFECQEFAVQRSLFSRRSTGRNFSFEVFECSSPSVCKAIVETGKLIYASVRDLCNVRRT